jgi:sulfite dehydrogenase (quinone) subunit SoeC
LNPQNHKAGFSRGWIACSPIELPSTLVHPAPSIIAFTTASGAGYGVLFLLGLAVPAGLIPTTPAFGLAALGLALGLITFGLLASLLHLGHPERAWRAVSQWRSSWLSREGAAALLTYLPALGFAAGWLVLGRADGWIAVLGLLTALGAALTVYCTSMIYASLKPVREWRQRLVPPVYLAFALMTGALLLHALLLLFGAERGWAAALALLATALAFGLKGRYWAAIGRPEPGPTPETATGLGAGGTVRMLEPPHTETNYLLSEMGFLVARKHAAKLRWYACLFGGLGAALLTVLALLSRGALASLLVLLAALSGIAGVLIERWLFFAEATHTVILYYGRRTD